MGILPSNKPRCASLSEAEPSGSIQELLFSELARKEEDELDDRVTQLSNKSPQHPSHFRDIIQEYIEEMEKLAFKLMELIAMSLGLQPKRLEEFFMRGQTSLIRLNYYPPCPFPHIALGVGPHKDESALTILAQDEVEGLEVKHKTHQEWVRVKPTPNDYIINVGDIIQDI